MDFDDFVGRVINELDLGSRPQGIRAVRAVLTSLSQRIQEGEASDLAASLPMEIDFYVRNAESGQRFSYEYFIDSVSEIEGVDRSDASYHAKIVVKILGEAIPQREMDDLKSNLPEEFDELFELVD